MNNLSLLVVFILFLTNHLIMTFFLNIPIKYRCPICNSNDTVEYDKIIECQYCGRKWHKDFISNKIEKEDTLSNEELNGFLKAFNNELRDPEKRRRFLNSIKEELQ